MNDSIEKDWGLVLSGVLLAICSFVFIFAPSATLATLTWFAGIAFVVAGVFDVINSRRIARAGFQATFGYLYAVIDILVGLLMLVYPVAFSVVLPWALGIGLVFFGALETMAGVRSKGILGIPWGWLVTTGIIGMLFGLLVIVFPGLICVFAGLFMLVRAVSLVLAGFGAVRLWC